MKLDDYKSTMGSVKLDADAKRRILASCKNGTQPSAFTREKRVSPVLRRTLAFVATLATVAAVAVGLFLLMRFIGPETPVEPNGDAGSNQEISNELAAVGFRLLSVESTLEGLTARVDSYDAKTKTVGMAWVNNSGKDLGLGRAYSLYKMDGEEWVTTPFEKQVFWEEDLREFPNGTECSNYGVIGSLTRWSDNITAGKYKVEKEFYGEVNCTVTIIFELISSTEINGFKLISVDSTLEGLTATVDSYNANTKSIGVTWVNDSGQSLIFGAPYTILKLIDGEWSAWADKEAIFQADARLFPSGDTCSDYGGIGSLTRWSDNITPGRYKVEKIFNGSEAYTVTIIFELTSEETEEETANEGISNFRYISDNDDIGVAFGGYSDGVLKLVWSNASEETYVYPGVYHMFVYRDGEWFLPAKVQFAPGTSLVKPGEKTGQTNIVFDVYFPKRIDSGEYKISITLNSLDSSKTANIEVYFTLSFDEGICDFSSTTSNENISFEIYDYDGNDLMLNCINRTEYMYRYDGRYSLYRKNESGQWEEQTSDYSYISSGIINIGGSTGYPNFRFSCFYKDGAPSGEYKISFELTAEDGLKDSPNDVEVELRFTLKNSNKLPEAEVIRDKVKVNTQKISFTTGTTIKNLHIYGELEEFKNGVVRFAIQTPNDDIDFRYDNFYRLYKDNEPLSPINDNPLRSDSVRVLEYKGYYTEELFEFDLNYWFANGVEAGDYQIRFRLTEGDTKNYITVVINITFENI